MLIRFEEYIFEEFDSSRRLQRSLQSLLGILEEVPGILEVVSDMFAEPVVTLKQIAEVLLEVRVRQSLTLTLTWMPFSVCSHLT